MVKLIKMAKYIHIHSLKALEDKDEVTTVRFNIPIKNKDKALELYPTDDFYHQYSNTKIINRVVV